MEMGGKGERGFFGSGILCRLGIILDFVFFCVMGFFLKKTGLIFFSFFNAYYIIYYS